MPTTWHIHKDTGWDAQGPCRVDFIEYPVGGSGTSLRNIYLYDLLQHMRRLSVYWDEMGHLKMIWRGRDAGLESGGTMVWHIHGDDGVPNGRVAFQVVTAGTCDNGSSSSSSSSGIDCNGIQVKELLVKCDEMGHWFLAENCLTSVTIHTMPAGYGGCAIEAYVFPSEIEPISSSGSSSSGCHPCVNRLRYFDHIRVHWGEEGHLRKIQHLGQFIYQEVINTACDSAGAVRDPCCVDDFGDAQYVNFTCRNLNVRMQFTCTSSPLVLIDGAGIISYDDANNWWQGDIDMGCVGVITVKVVCEPTGIGTCEYRRKMYFNGIETTSAISEGDAPSCCPVDFLGGHTSWLSHSCDCGIPPTPGIPGVLTAHVYECEL